MGMTKGKAGMGTGDNAQYMKKGGKKMMTGGMNNSNAKATPMKKGGMYKKGGMKKGM
jgi:hypothetical protein